MTYCMYIHKSGYPCLDYQKYGEFCEKHKIVYEPIEFDEQNECSICMDVVSENKVKLFCGHTFHKKCIKKWCFVKNNCPLCRKTISVFVMEELFQREIIQVNNYSPSYYETPNPEMQERPQEPFNLMSCLFDMCFGCLYHRD